MYLHLVSFDVPYPANYGGVIVVFHQIRALHAAGVKVILHCFQYGERLPQPALEEYCQEVHYYARSRSAVYQLHWLPFIMRTRMSNALVQRLRQDNYPIFCEGLHTSALVWNPLLRDRQKLVRMHNVEWQYYRSLARLAPPLHIFKKLYHFIESVKLRHIEAKVLRYAEAIVTLSSHDNAYYRALKANTHYIAAFHANDTVESRPGRGGYVLFHGKLSVPDNERAAAWLIEAVFSKMNVPLVIAGMDPPAPLRALINRYSHIQLVENPDDRHMRALIAEAHINLLVSFQTAGIKLKLINALFQGRFCVVNETMVSGTGLDHLCSVCDSGAAICQTIVALMKIPFGPDQIEQRRATLEAEFSNQANARKLMALIEFS